MGPSRRTLAQLLLCGSTLQDLADEDATFRPAINPRSQQLAEERMQRNLDQDLLEALQPGERLYYEAMEAKQAAR